MSVEDFKNNMIFIVIFMIMMNIGMSAIVIYHNYKDTELSDRINVLEQLVDELCIRGNLEECGEIIQEFKNNGQ